MNALLKLAPVLILISAAAIAGAEPQTFAETAAPESTGAATPERDRIAADEAWWRGYERAREAFVRERYAEAALLFKALRVTAPRGEQQRLALEMEMLAGALSVQHRALEPDLRRSSDELSLLYSTAFIYGFGTSAWLSLVTEPQSFVAAVLPFAVITTGSVGAVAVADGYRPFPAGVPHAISSGAYLGLLEGVWIVGLQHADAERRDVERWTSAELSTVLWSGATLGGIGGALVGFTLEPPAGHSSFVASAGLWAGTLSALAAASFEPDSAARGEYAFVAAGAGLNVGILGGLLTASWANPGVARMRFVDVGGLGGGLLGAGAYTVLAGDNAKVSNGLGASSIGAAAGLGLLWWLTDDMPSAGSRPGVSPPLDSLSLTPSVRPLQGGMVFELIGYL